MKAQLFFSESPENNHVYNTLSQNNMLNPQEITYQVIVGMN